MRRGKVVRKDKPTKLGWTVVWFHSAAVTRIGGNGMTDREWRDYEMGRGPSPGDTRMDEEWEDRLDEKGDVAFWQQLPGRRNTGDTAGDEADKS